MKKKQHASDPCVHKFLQMKREKRKLHVSCWQYQDILSYLHIHIYLFKYVDYSSVWLDYLVMVYILQREQNETSVTQLIW